MNELGDLLRTAWWAAFGGALFAAFEGGSGVDPGDWSVVCAWFIGVAVVGGLGVLDAVLLAVVFRQRGLAGLLVPAGLGAGLGVVVGAVGVAAFHDLPREGEGAGLLLALGAFVVTMLAWPGWAYVQRRVARREADHLRGLLAALPPDGEWAPAPGMRATFAGSLVQAGSMAYTRGEEVVRVGRHHGHPVVIEGALVEYSFDVPAVDGLAQAARLLRQLVTRSRDELSWSSCVWLVAVSVDADVPEAVPTVHVAPRRDRELLSPLLGLERLRFESIELDERVAVRATAASVDWWRVFSPELIDLLAGATAHAHLEVVVAGRRAYVVLAGRRPDGPALEAMLDVATQVHVALARVFASA
jgi:hypothetical protein